MDTNNAAANGICFPYDVLLDILRRLPGRALATSRLVCGAWRGIVDAHSLVLPHVFPREFPGIFATYHGYEPRSALFAPPASREHRPRDADEPTRRRPLFWDDWYRVRQHCNGLFLLTHGYMFGHSAGDMYVCNPATLRYARLPCPPPPPRKCSVEGIFLAFDPAVSRHHEVFYFPTQKMPEHVEVEPGEPSWIDLEQPFLPNLFGEEEPIVEEQPSQEEHHESRAEEPCRVHLKQAFLPNMSREEQQGSNGEESAGSTIQFDVPALEGLEEMVLHVFVFSSRTNKWESREFTPGRCTSRHLYNMVTAPHREEMRAWWSAEYWRGSLYVQCHSGVLMILQCSEGTYNLVQLPGHPYDDADLLPYALPKRCVLANYKRGICYVLLNEFQLEVWELTQLVEDQLRWTLIQEANLISEKPRMQPRMTWEVVESNKDLIRLFEDEINDLDAADGTEENMEDGDSYDEAQAEEEEEQDNADETQGREEGELDGQEEKDNSDDDNSDHEDEELGSGTSSLWGWEIRIVGFHPHKDMLLLQFSDIVVAYHLRASRMQYLGNIYPQRHCQQARDVHGAFPYRPCYIDALPVRKTSSSS